MWCRTILTAIAISYVICMLLWSGLQKEELDASTLEKLSRYNVNIEDLNNEQRRQECLLNHLTTEAQREALRTSASKDRIENDVTVEIYPKIGMLLAANFEDKAVVQFNSNDTTGNFKELRVNAAKLPDLGNVTAGEANKAIIKIEYNIQNQPDVESVMNFWTKLTHRTTTVATLPTTLVAPLTKTVHSKTYKVKNGLETAQAETQNDGYVHSREMEYISRILTEYLASQTIPTTTESISTNTAFANYVPTKYWELSNKAAVDEEPKVDEKNNQTNKMNATQDNSQAIYNSMIDEDRRKPFKETFDTQLMKIIQETPSSQTLLAETKVRESKPVERTNAKGFLNRLLRMKSDLFNNGFAIPETESETKATNKSNKQQDKINSYKLFNLFKNIKDANKNNSHNFTINGDQSINASIKAETMVTNKPEPEVRPTDVKKSEVHENTNLKHRGSRFQAMLPSIKYSKQNKNSESVNRQVIGTPTEFNKPEPHENDEVEVLGAKKGIVSQQPAAIEKFDKNQLFKMKKDTFNTDSKKLNTKQFKKSPMFQTLNDSERINPIQEIVYQPTQTKDVGSLNMSDLQTIPASIITEIAEQVKRMVLKDMGENVTTTTVKTTSSTSNITTTEPPPTMLQNKITQSNHVMQKLMEIFKELNTMKDTAKLISQMPQNSSTVNYGTKILSQSPKQPKTPASFNPYLMQNPSNFKPKQATFYASMVPASSSGVYSQNKFPQYLPPLNTQPTKDYHFGAITIQTNSDEIAPLPIQISKPTKLMNQHIVLTTKRTVDKMKEDYTMKREQESMKHIEDQFRIPNEDRNHRQKVKVESDLPKSVRFAEKHEVRDRYSYRGGYLDREKPLYHEYHEKVHNIEHPVRSRFPELHYPGRLTHLEHSGRPRDLSTSEDSSPSRGYSRPGYNKQGSHKSGIRHHPGSYSHSAHDRQPQYEATKFHEKLERIENWPRSTWKDFHSPSDSSNDEISARQQMPLVKVKKRTRYDDTHFTNFLKSQQKVTDMLEKILANNLKNSGPHSVDTP